MTDQDDAPPQWRERDDELGVDDAALEALRTRLADHVDATQGAFHRRSAVARLWPALLAAVLVYAWAFTGAALGALRPSALLAMVAGALALAAVVIAPSGPARAERVGVVALVVAGVAAVAEVLRAWLDAPAQGAGTLQCATEASVGALVPVALLALYLRRARVPARRVHVAAMAIAAFFASAAAVWAGCPGNALAHLTIGHVGGPLLVGVVTALLLAPLVRGARLPAST